MNPSPPFMGRAVGAWFFSGSFVGRCPTLVSGGPLALDFRANGAPPSQPGATPQETSSKNP